MESLAKLAEIIGATAVVVSLIYLAVEVRQNTQAQRTEIFFRALERAGMMPATLSQDSGAAVILSKGVVEPSNLIPKERRQFTRAMYELFGAFEIMFLASRDAARPDEVSQRWSAALAWWLTFPGVQTWWEMRLIPFGRSLTPYVDALLENNPTDTELSRRYQDLVAQGKRLAWRALLL